MTVDLPSGGHITKFIGSRHPDFIWKKHPDFGTKENPVLEDYIHEAVNGCLKKTGVPAKAVQKAWIGNFAGELFSSQVSNATYFLSASDEGSPTVPRPNFRATWVLPLLVHTLTL